MASVLMALLGLLLRKAMTKTEAYRNAYEAYHLAQSNLAAATVAAFPLGAAVVSYARKTPIYGKVVGHGAAWNNPGSILVKNDNTGKTHRAIPHFNWNGKPGAELL
jgi:predicted lipid-binding transport protein (Tim44 family)